VIGREELAMDARQRAGGRAAQADLCPATDSVRPSLALTTTTTTASRGFTLLELMIVISIIVILAVIAMPQYQKSVIHARETVLRDDLYHLRRAIDLYGADKGKLPQSLDDLVTAGYIREIPVDPMTNERDWQVVSGEDPSSLTSESGIIDLHSASTDISTQGTPYNEW
jgi:general secretion pathway protein G